MTPNETAQTTIGVVPTFLPAAPAQRLRWGGGWGGGATGGGGMPCVGKGRDNSARPGGGAGARGNVGGWDVRWDEEDY
jgi:hypothetical protein